MQHTGVFILSLGGSLTKWEKDGILDREFLITKKYVENEIINKALIYTYSRNDRLVLEKMTLSPETRAKIELLAPPAFFDRMGGRLKTMLYSITGPFFHRRAFSGASFMRTNQISGCWAALVAKIFFRTPLLLRFGYILSRRLQLNGQHTAAAVARAIESFAFSLSNAIVLTSKQAWEETVSRVNDVKKVHLIRSYVDTTVFQEKTDYDFAARLIYVGRLTPQKNLPGLIQALEGTGVALDLVGVGEQEAELKALAEKLGVEARFLGQVPNTKLAELMGQYTYFVLPSFHEGLPKVLIEAMATGLICIGTNVSGTNDLIKDSESGYLAAGTSPEEIRTAIQRALADRNPAMGANARRLIEAQLGIDVYVRAEKSVIEAL